ncbi:hypothetical protein, partial [Burkholderia multivorans]|uniref:hypothetical protein n=1 Tax=Burkholderia multivorans TaxID=87883 RepID=UPI001C615E2A
RPLDPLFHLPPLRLGEKVSTYFRTGHRNEKSPLDAGFLPNAADAAGATYDQRSWLIAVR